MRKLLIAAFSALMATGAAASSVKQLKPGQYDVGGLEQICIVADGTWYSPTYITWTGKWANIGNEDRAIVFGHYDDGVGDVGEDSIVVEKTGIDWTEWTDDFSDTLFNDDYPITRVKTKCDQEDAAKFRLMRGKSPMR